MMEFLLSDTGHPILLSFLIIIPITPFIILGLCNKTKSRHEPSTLSGLVTLTTAILLVIISLFIVVSTKFDYISDENWKQIYTNNIDATVKLKVNSTDFLFKLKEEIIAGENINKIQYTSLTQSGDNKITVEKNGTSYSKQVLIEKDNIISNSDVISNSKITKIEYKNIQGHQRTLFGYKGPIEKNKKYNIDGKIRITLEQDSTEKELKQMFENNN